jgi:hypothetical protein
VVGDADNVAGLRLLGEVALAGEEKHRGLHRHLPPGADVLQFHAALEPAGGDPHKGDAVAVLRVDIGLHLEDETGDTWLLGRDRPGGCGRGAGANSPTPCSNSRTPKLFSALPK